MASINIAVVEGNLVKAAELSRWQDGTPYCKFTVANNESYKDSAGEWHDIPSFIDCIIRGAYAETVSRRLLKGQRVTVTGRLKQQTWTDEGGQKHSRIVIKVRDISVFQKQADGQGAANGAVSGFGQEQKPEQPYSREEYNPAWFDGNSFDGTSYDGAGYDGSEEIPF